MFACVLSAFAVAGCDSSRKENPPAENEKTSVLDSEVGRVFLVCIDGATWDIIDPLLEKGQLPNFQELIAAGQRGTLKSLMPSRSSRIWTSVATGVAPEKHGILDFVYEKDSKRHLYTSEMIRVPTLWDIASANGIPVGVTNYWFTYPAWPIKGFVISDHTIPSRSERLIAFFSKNESPAADPEHLVYPPKLWDRIKPLLEATPIVSPDTEVDSPTAINYKNMTYRIYNIEAEDKLVIDMAIVADREFTPQLMAVYLKGIDRASHWFWRFFHPDDPNYEFERQNARQIKLYEDVIPKVYRQTDALLGKLRARLNPDDVIIVVSDHGFQSIPLRGNISGSHGDSPKSVDGIYLIAGGPTRKSTRGPALSLFDIAPTVLHLLGLPVPRYMQGKVADAVFDSQFMERQPVRFVDAYNLADRPRSDAPGEVPLESERINELKALGYLK